MFPLEVRESGIPEAGVGLFTTLAIKAGTKITAITGEFISEEESARRQDKRYMVIWKKGVVLDAINSDSMGKWVNCAGDSGFLPNAKLGYDRRHQQISVIAINAIPAGAEILAGYDF